MYFSVCVSVPPDEDILAQLDEDAPDEVVEDKMDPNETDNQSNKSQDGDSDTSEESTKNEYMGLSKENLNDDDNSSKSSSGTLYTLLDGKTRYVPRQDKDIQQKKKINKKTQ